MSRNESIIILAFFVKKHDTFSNQPPKHVKNTDNTPDRKLGLRFQEPKKKLSTCTHTLRKVFDNQSPSKQIADN